MPIESARSEIDGAAPSGLSPLARELGKRRPFEHAEVEGYVSLVRTISVLRVDHDALLKKVGLSEATYNILRTLRHSPNGKTCGQIGAELITRVPDVTRLLDGLQRKGLIERQRSSEDRRAVVARATAKGLTLLDTLDEPVLEAHRRQFAGVTSAELKGLIGLLDKVRAGTTVSGR